MSCWQTRPARKAFRMALLGLAFLLNCSLAHVVVQLRTAPFVRSCFFTVCLRLTCPLLLFLSCRKLGQLVLGFHAARHRAGNLTRSLIHQKAP